MYIIYVYVYIYMCSICLSLSLSLSVCGLCIILARSHASVASERDNLSAISLTLLLFRYSVIFGILLFRYFGYFASFCHIPLARVNLAAIYAKLLRILFRILFSFGSKTKMKNKKQIQQKKNKKIKGKNKYLNLSKQQF